MCFQRIVSHCAKINVYDQVSVLTFLYVLVLLPLHQQKWLKPNRSAALVQGEGVGRCEGKTQQDQGGSYQEGEGGIEEERTVQIWLLKEFYICSFHFIVRRNEKRAIKAT